MRDLNMEGSANSYLVRHVNEMLVLGLMRKHIELSIPEIERMTSLTYPTVSKVITSLKEKGLLEESGEGLSRGGRRPKLLRFRHDAGVFVGAEVDKTRIIVAGFSMNYRMISKVVLPLQSTNPSTVRECIVKGIEEVTASLEPHQVLYGVGIGCPGMIDPKAGTVISRSTLRWLQPVDLAGQIREDVGAPVFVQNDINVAALGEMSRFDDGETMDSWAYISVATGVGSGIVLNHQILKGHAGGAGELGHLSVNCDGIACECGSRGCLESYISTPALSRLLGIPEDDHSTAYMALQDRVRALDPNALDIYHNTVKYLSTAIIGLVNLLNPYAIMIGGAILELGEPFLQDLRKAVGAGCGNVSFDPEQIFFSQLGTDAVIYGGAVLADQHVFGVPQLAPAI
ncbi:MAG: ROK family transcriptional regulator [Limnochordia bacterium]|jgi:predicted NBD/HSP70 family sugar kinase